MRPIIPILLVAGCSGSPGVEAELLDAADASARVESSLAKLATFLGPDPDTVLVDPAAACVTRNAAATNTASAGQNEYHFVQCSLGGIGVVNGDVTLVYGVTGPALHLDLTATGAFSIDQTTLTAWNASADLTENGTGRTVVWVSRASGTTAVRQTPRAFDDEVSATLRWATGSSCLDINGQIASTFEASDGTQLSYSGAFVSFMACAACPENGSEVRADFGSGQFIRLRYGADDAASYTNERGQTFAFVPSCAE